MPKENYSEKEVARIIKRAAELESRQSDEYESLDSGPGLSLDELSQIAIDAGLDPENVRRAAGELSSNPQDSSSTDSVQGNEVISEKWVKGEFTNELADLVIADLNHRYNTTHEKPNWKDNILNDATVDPERQSTVQRTENSLEWKKLNKHGEEELRVLIQSRNERIRIRVVKQNSRRFKLPDQNSVIGYLSYVPFLAGIIMLMALPYSFLFNAIFAIITFALLQFGISRAKGKLHKSESADKDTALNSYHLEVKNLAQNLAEFVKHPKEENKSIEIDERTKKTDSRNSDLNRSRSRS